MQEEGYGYWFALGAKSEKCDYDSPFLEVTHVTLVCHSLSGGAWLLVNVPDCRAHIGQGVLFMQGSFYTNVISDRAVLTWYVRQLNAY